MIVPKLISPNVSHTHSGDDSRGRIVGPLISRYIQARTGNKGKNGYHRIGVRHGVATITRGRRSALGVIFHDSQ